MSLSYETLPMSDVPPDPRGQPADKNNSTATRDFLSDFISTNQKAGRIKGLETKKPSQIAHICTYIRKLIAKCDFPLTIVKRGTELYLIRTDIQDGEEA